MILGDIIRRNAAFYGDRTGLVFEGRRFTHRAFAARVNRAANALLARGIRPQERVALLARNCSEGLEVLGAGETAGFITVNINNRLSVDEVAGICADSEPAALVFEPDFAPAAAALRARMPSIRHFLRIGGRADGADDYEAALAAASETAPSVLAAPDDIAYLIYTSGTTGRPKGVVWRHRAMIEAVRALTLEGCALEPITALIVMPLFHVGARIESLSFLLLGGTLVLHRTFDAVAALETIERERITAMHCAPIMIQRILDVPDRAAYATGSLQHIRYASAPMPVPLLRRALAAFGPIFGQVYGMTECHGGTRRKPHEHVVDGDARDGRRLASAGRPYLGTDLRIARGDGSDAALGETGEILLRTPATMAGYWNNPAATADALRDGWFHTGDLGHVDGDGFLFVVDRMKDMIISGGENIYSWEVEEALRHHPAVAEAAVIAVPDREWGEAVKACVIVRGGMAVGEDELIAHCRARIASYKKPRSVDFVSDLPRLFNGKVDKKALRAPYWAARKRQVS